MILPLLPPLSLRVRATEPRIVRFLAMFRSLLASMMVPDRPASKVIVLPGGETSMAWRSDPGPWSWRLVTRVGSGGLGAWWVRNQPAVLIDATTRSNTAISLTAARTRRAALARRNTASCLLGGLRLAQAFASFSCDPRYSRSLGWPRCSHSATFSLSACCRRTSSRASHSQSERRDHSRIRASWLTSPLETFVFLGCLQREFFQGGAAARGILLGVAGVDQPQEERARQRAMFIRGERGIGLLRVPGQRAFHAADVAVGRKRELRAAAPLEELIERKFQQGQGSCLPLHFVEQVAYLAALERQAHIGQRRWLSHRRAQFVHLHERHGTLMPLDQPPQRR